jgi:hypothetical protein
MKLFLFSLAVCVIACSASAFAQSRPEIVKLYEQRGFCAAQKEIRAKARCFEVLAAEAIAVAEAAAVPVAAALPVVVARSPAEVEAEKKATELAARQRRFEPVFRAMTAIQAATETGVTWMQFGPLLLGAATEIAVVAQAAASDQERASLAELETAMSAYKDSATWWERDISFYSRSGNALAYAGGLPFKQVGGLEEMITRWNLPTQKSDIWGLYQGVPRRAALVTMWTAAEQAVRRATEALQPQ